MERFSRREIQAAVAAVLVIALAGGLFLGSRSNDGDDTTLAAGGSTTTSEPDADELSSTNADPDEDPAEIDGETTTTQDDIDDLTDGSACPEGSIPATASDVLAGGSADLDGDGVEEVVTRYRFAQEADAERWWLYADLSGGGSMVHRGSKVIGVPEGIASRGGTDLDGDDRDELFVRVGHSASAELIGVWTMDTSDCSLDPLNPAGDDYVGPFAVGGTIGHVDGLSCDEGHPTRPLASHRWEHRGDGTYDEFVTYWSIVGGDLVPEEEIEGSTTGRTACGDLPKTDLPGPEPEPGPGDIIVNP